RAVRGFAVGEHRTRCALCRKLEIEALAHSSRCEDRRRQSNGESDVERHRAPVQRRIQLIRKPAHLISPNTRRERRMKVRRIAVNTSLRARVTEIALSAAKLSHNSAHLMKVY